MKPTIAAILLSLAACREPLHPEIMKPSPAIAAHFLGTAAVANAVAKQKAPVPPPAAQPHPEGSR